MAKKNDNSMHWIIGVVLLVTGVLIIAALVVTYSQAEDVNANVNIDNDAPIIDTANAEIWQDPGDDGTNSVLAGTAATPGPTVSQVVGGNTNVIVKVNVSDSNGWASQPINLSARLLRTSTDGTAIVAFEQNFGASTVRGNPSGTPAACSAIANVSSTERTFLCGINMRYNSVPTTPGSEVSDSINFSNEHWRLVLKASDTVTNVELNDAIHYEYALGIGITTPGILDLGTIATDGVPGPVSNLSVQNDGNQVIDIITEATETDDATAWSCTGSGNPLISDVHVGGDLADLNYSALTALTTNGTPYTHTVFDLQTATNPNTPPSGSARFRIATTEPISPGVCTLSSVILSAVKGF